MKKGGQREREGEEGVLCHLSWPRYQWSASLPTSVYKVCNRKDKVWAEKKEQNKTKKRHTHGRHRNLQSDDSDTWWDKENVVVINALW